MLPLSQIFITMSNIFSQYNEVWFSVRNLLFGLGLVSNPSKVGNSYKFCLSAPTTVNTLYAEKQPKMSNFGNVSSSQLKIIVFYSDAADDDSF